MKRFWSEGEDASSEVASERSHALAQACQELAYLNYTPRLRYTHEDQIYYSRTRSMARVPFVFN